MVEIYRDGKYICAICDEEISDVACAGEENIKRNGFMHFRDLIESYLSIEDAEKFAEWAFGPNFKGIHQPEIPKYWNELHSDLFVVLSSGRPVDDIKKMIDAWIKNMKDVKLSLDP